MFQAFLLTHSALSILVWTSKTEGKLNRADILQVQLLSASILSTVYEHLWRIPIEHRLHEHFRASKYAGAFVRVLTTCEVVRIALKSAFLFTGISLLIIGSFLLFVGVILGFRVDDDMWFWTLLGSGDVLVRRMATRFYKPRQQIQIITRIQH